MLTVSINVSVLSFLTVYYLVLSLVEKPLLFVVSMMCSSFQMLIPYSVFLQSVELDMKHDCKPLMERINVFKAAFSENEDNER